MADMNVFDVLKEKLNKEKNSNSSLMEQAEFWRNGIDSAIEIVNQLEKEVGVSKMETDGWIPVSERYPENDDYVLVSFDNFSLPDLGRYEQDEDGGAFYPGDEEKSYTSFGLFVNAWQPLPPKYEPKEE